LIPISANLNLVRRVL